MWWDLEATAQWVRLVVVTEEEIVDEEVVVVVCEVESVVEELT